jgi:GTP-binding protein Era
MPHRAGFVAIVGRPNVGKSTLLNALVGTKVAIVTPKPQTTRNRIVGIRTLPEAQAMFVDTPGIHDARSSLNRRMVDVAQQALADADVVLLVLDANAGVTGGDRDLVAAVAPLAVPVVVVLNKIDRVAKPALLPLLAKLGGLLPGRDLIPISARSGDGVPTVLQVVTGLLPEGPRLYPEDDFTAETERFLVQEMIREQVFLGTEEEVPYGTAVVVEEWTEKPDQNLLVVQATILVDRENHKGMIIGAGGERLKEIGQRARHALEGLFGSRVYLELFVRVEPGWARDPRRLAEIGL